MKTYISTLGIHHGYTVGHPWLRLSTLLANITAVSRKR